MISWLQSHFQKHNRIIFLVLLAVIVVSFVFTIGAMPGFGRSQGHFKEHAFFGFPLSTQEDMQQFFGKADLSAYLQSGNQQISQDQIQQYAFSRAAALYLANKLHIPDPTSEEAQDYIKTMGAFADSKGNFDPKKYSEYLDNLKTNPRLSNADVAEVVNNDYRIKKVRHLLSGPGYVLPDEVKDQIARVDTEWTVETASLDYKAFSPNIPVTDSELKSFYKDNSARFQVPERVKVSYVEFNAVDFLSQVNLTEDQIKSYFDHHRYQYTKPAPKTADTKGKTSTPKTVPAQLSDVRAQVVKDAKIARAKILAEKAASDFAYNLFDKKVKLDSPQFTKAIKDLNLTEKTTPAFTENATPPVKGWNHEIVSEAFSLTKDRYYSDPLPAGNNTVVLFLEKKMVPTVPPLPLVRSKVEAAYRDAQKHKLFTEKGKELSAKLTAEVKSGKSFTAAAKSLGLTTKTWPAFSMEKPPKDIGYSVVSNLDQFTVRKPSDMIVSKGVGEIVYVDKKVVPHIADNNPKYKQTLDRLKTFSSQLTGGGLIQEMVNAELQRSGLASVNQ